MATTTLTEGAELVVFSSGRVLPVETFRIMGDMAAVELVAGGEIWFPSHVVRRIDSMDTDGLSVVMKVKPALNAKNRTNAAPGTPADAFEFETARAENLDTAEIDPGESDSAESITGTVLSEDGDPVDGVEIRARALRLFHPEEGGKRPQEVQGLSERNGSYRLDQLPPGEYNVHSLATDRYNSARTTVRTGDTLANLILNEKRELAIFGTVTNTIGEPLQAASVTQAVGSTATATSDLDGYYRFEIPRGSHGQTYKLIFEHKGYSSRVLTFEDSQVAGRSEFGLNASLESLDTLVVVEGTVSNPQGAPVSGQTVFLVGEQNHQAVTDQSGGFLIPEVTAGVTYQFWISPRGDYQKHQEEVLVGAEGLNLEVTLKPHASEYAKLSGRMINTNGTPVPNFSLWMRNSRSVQEPVLLTSDSAGAFSVPDAPVGRLTFNSVSDPRMTIGGPELSSAGMENLTLIIDWGTYEIRGRVVDSEGIPVASPQLSLEWSHRGEGGQSLSLRHASVDAYGSFVFTQVGPGLHSLKVSAAGFEPVQLQADSPGDLIVQLQARNKEGALQD
ncbi:MAG: carboxypeptidase-like regulatory domain-containing protein [Acidobacteriota bacterium]|nr:carboxypeptidase-like regulatory domain-containing protein [Acidobacteriota bacterium]